MRVEITARFDIEVPDSEVMELVNRRLLERLDETGEVITGVAVVYKYPDHRHAGYGITIDSEWERVQQGSYMTAHQSSETVANHPDAVPLLVASGSAPQEYPQQARATGRSAIKDRS